MRVNVAQSSLPHKLGTFLTEARNLARLRILAACLVDIVGAGPPTGTFLRVRDIPGGRERIDAALREFQKRLEERGEPPDLLAQPAPPFASDWKPRR